MILQISSGMGPIECELGVGKLFEALAKEFGDLDKIYERPSIEKDCYKSIIFSTKEDLSFLEGTVKWICTSPFRQHHKRKNWFIDVSILVGDEELFSKEKNSEKSQIDIPENEICFERFHSGGKGGQNVNKVETGVRITHLPTKISVTSTAERSQKQNREDAMRKLRIILEATERRNKAAKMNDAWMEHNRLERGNPVRVYKGMEFKLSGRDEYAVF